MEYKTDKDKHEASQMEMNSIDRTMTWRITNIADITPYELIFHVFSAR